MNRVIQAANRYLLNTYQRPPVVFKRGEGPYLFDTGGTRYLDFVAGIGVNALGYNHPLVHQAITEAAQGVIHISNLYHSKAPIELAELLVSSTFDSRVFFTNSGSEAVETALKISRKWGKQFNPERTKILAFEESFHGRTFGALSVTFTEKYRKPFEPVLPGVVFLPFNDADALNQVDFSELCCVILEPVQGEGGLTPAGSEFLATLREKTRQNDVVLIFDEIQCGVSRSGKLYVYQHYGVEPEILLTAKALGAGFPIGAALISPKFAELIQPGDHGSTFGGNPFISHVAKKAFALLSSRDFLRHVAEVADYFEKNLIQLKEKYAFVQEIKGIGLMRGLKISRPVARLVEEAFAHRLLVARAGHDVLRFLPPLIIEKKHVDEAIGILDTIFKKEGGE